MANLTATKTEVLSSYIKIPQELSQQSLESCRSRARVLILSRIIGYSASCGACYVTNAELSRRLGVSRKTVSNVIQSLKSDKLIAQNKDLHTVTKYSSDARFAGGFFTLPEYMLTEKFQCYGNTDERVRRLNKSEALVFAFIKWHFDRNEKCLSSVNSLAKGIGISACSVRRALGALLSAELIYNPVKAVNKSALATYTVNAKLIRYMDKQHARKPKRKTSGKETALQTKEAAEIAAGNEYRADRERFYSKLQDARRNALERYENALGDSYRCAGIRIQRMQSQIAKADICGDKVTLLKLNREETQLKAYRAQILIDSNIKLPEYRCQKCCDSGNLPNGKPCDCYPGTVPIERKMTV